MASVLSLPGSPGVCGCGCGAAVARSFVPGHDARLRGALSRAFRADASAVVQFELADGERGEFRRAFLPVTAVLAAHAWALPLPAKVRPTKHTALLAALVPAE